MNKSILTEYSPELEKIILDILSKKHKDSFNRHVSHSTNPRYFYINGSDYAGVTYYHRSDFDREYIDVTAAQFLTALEARRNKGEVFEGEINGYKAIIAPDQIKIGCQEYSPEEFTQIGEAVEKLREGIRIKLPGRGDIVVKHDGIRSESDDKAFTYDHYYFVTKKLEEFKEKKK